MTRALLFGDTPHRMAGAQRSLLAAVTAALGLGLEPVLVFPSEGLAVDASRAAGLPVVVLEGTAAFKTFGKALLRMGSLGQARVALTELWPYARRLARVVEAERAEVVHFNTARGAIMAGLAAHLAGRQIVLHVRGTPALGAAPWAVAQAMSDRFILVASALERCLTPAARARARVVHNGVVVPPPHDWTSAREPTIVALSSLVPFKGLHHLVGAVRSLRDRGVTARFVLAGSGLGDEYEKWLRRLPSELGVADLVSFVGFVPDTGPLLAAADALVLPSVERESLLLEGNVIDVRGNEGLPRSVLEAMAAGLPVIASDIAGVREQVEPGATGLLVPPGDPVALGAALERLLRDAAFRREAGDAAREVVRARFSVDAAGRGLLDVLREASRPRLRAARAKDSMGVLLDALHARAGEGAPAG